MVANQFGADILHVHQIEFRLNIVRKHLTRPIPIVLHMHNLDRSYQSKVGSADAYVAASKTIRQHMLGQGFPADKVQVVSNAVDTAVFDPKAVWPELLAEMKQRYGIDDGKHMLLFFGLREKRKGYDSYLEMLKRFDQKGVPVLGIAIGVGHANFDFQALEDELVKAGLLHVLKPQRHEVLNHFIQLSKAVILLSRAEPQGMAMIEAMGAGGILISGRVGGIKESVVDRETGFLIDPPFEHQELDQLIEHVINMSAEQRAKIASQARNRIVENYSIQASAKKLEQLYDRLLDKV
jgi:glycosyltransferase involved in cell wall biosynthesis